jgi:hypothetical protein
MRLNHDGEGLPGERDVERAHGDMFANGQAAFLGRLEDLQRYVKRHAIERYAHKTISRTIPLNIDDWVHTPTHSSQTIRCL